MRSRKFIIDEIIINIVSGNLFSSNDMFDSLRDELRN
jgi:hypothetical protein